MRELKLGWLRKAEIKDASKIEWYSKERFWKQYDFSLLFSSSNPRHVVPLVCRIQDKPKSEKLVGYCVYRKTKNYFNILNLVVQPEYRRSGVATLFIQNLIQKLNSSKKLGIRIRLRESNKDAIPFLKSVGFYLNKTIPDFYKNYDKLSDIGKENSYEYEYRP